jgi:hypothetical protein
VFQLIYETGERGKGLEGTRVIRWVSGVTGLQQTHMTRLEGVEHTLILMSVDIHFALCHLLEQDSVIMEVILEQDSASVA